MRLFFQNWACAKSLLVLKSYTSFGFVVVLNPAVVQAAKTDKVARAVGEVVNIVKV